MPTLAAGNSATVLIAGHETYTVVSANNTNFRATFTPENSTVNLSGFSRSFGPLVTTVPLGPFGSPGSLTIVVDAFPTGGSVTYTYSSNTGLTPAAAAAAQQRAVIQSGFYGFKHDGSDESATLQAAIDSLWTTYGNRGAVLEMPPGKSTIVQGIILRPGVSIVCPVIYSNLTEINTEWWGHRFVFPTVASQPMFQNDINNGYIRQQSVDVPTPLPQRYTGVTLAGLSFVGSRNIANHTTNCDFVRLTRAWCTTILGCSGIDSRGFGVRALDCNVLNVIDSNFLYSGFFAFSLADSYIRGGNFGAGNGFSSTPFWITGQSQKNQITNNFFYNNQSNGLVGLTTRAYAFPMVVASVARNVDANSNSFLFATNATIGDNSHYWTTGTPVTISSTGTLPAPFVADTTYYVSVVNSGRVNFATTPERAASNTLIAITTVGSGTITVQVGENTNLYINDGCTKNRFSGLRSDQAFGAQILVGNAQANVFQDVISQEGSFGNYAGWTGGGAGVANVAPTPQAAVILRNSATSNVLGGTWSIDGLKTGSLNQATGNESRQKYGVQIDATSFAGTTIGNTTNSLNHTTANSEAGAANWNPAYANPNRIILSAQQFDNVTASSKVTFGGGRRAGWSMAATGTDGFIASVLSVPYGWQSVNVYIWWVPSAAGAGNVAWNLSLIPLDTAGNTNQADTVTTTVVATAAAGQDILAVAQLSAVDFSAFVGLQTFVRVKHAGTDGTNTFAAAPVFSHIVFERA